MVRRVLFLVELVLAGASLVAAADVETITHGQPVELAQHLVPGKMVLFDFYADWCGPCRALEPQVKRLAERHAATLAVRKVDIVDWNSPVSRQYRISSVPHLKLFSPDGVVLAEGNAPVVLDALERRLRGGGDAGVVARDRPRRWPLVALVAMLALVAWFTTRRGGRAGVREPSLAGRMDAPAVAAGEVPAAAGPALWFVMIQDSLEGPYAVAQLEELCRQGLITRHTEVRRRGDASWTTLDTLLG